jgi:selenocysteine lyase/cysteine desulfurase
MPENEAPAASPPESAPPQPSIDAFREGMPLIKNHVYMNHAAVSPLSDRVIQASQSALRIQQETPFDEDALLSGWRQAKSQIAKLIGATPREICLVPNTTSGLLAAILALRLPAGAEVVYPADDFPSVWNLVQNLGGEGLTPVEVKPGKSGIVTHEDLMHAITGKTKLIIASWVSYFNGFRHDLKALGRWCWEADVHLVVDGIQGLGAIPHDVKEARCDFLVAGGYKWLMGPMGSGFLYVSDVLLEELRPRFPGWKGIALDESHYLARTTALKPNATRFDTGTNALASTYGLAESVKVINEFGIANVWQAILSHTNRIIGGLAERGIAQIGTKNLNFRSGIVTFTLGDEETNGRLFTHLNERSIIVALREGAIRVSPHFYNTSADLDAFFEALDDFRKKKEAT